MALPERQTWFGGVAEDPDLVFADRPEAQELKLLLEAWSSWPRAGRLPARARFDPADFPKLLPWICLIEFDGHRNRYRAYDGLFRYLGSAHVEQFRAQGLTGTYVSAMPDPFPERWFRAYDRLIERAAPMSVRGKPYLVGKSYLRFEMLFLPLCRNAPEDQDAVAFNLSCVRVEPAQ
ncbi:MAG TPA: hypothetical protein VMT54_01240 [Candidatus Cybelea sp.]|nr:hypothetical protein [Candidatus Cybelea sp.]